jgi:hypothetical protein
LAVNQKTQVLILAERNYFFPVSTRVACSEKKWNAEYRIRHFDGMRNANLFSLYFFCERMLKMLGSNKRHPPILPTFRLFLKRIETEPTLSTAAPLRQRLLRGSTYFTDNEALLSVITRERPLCETNGSGSEPVTPQTIKLAEEYGLARMPMGHGSEAAIWYVPGGSNHRLAEHLRDITTGHNEWAYAIAAGRPADGHLRCLCFQGLAFQYDPFWIAHWCWSFFPWAKDDAERYGLVRRELVAAWLELQDVRAGKLGG